MNLDDFRRLGHALIDWLADYRARLPTYPVMAPVAPGEVGSRLPAAPPLRGEALSGLPAELDRLVLPGLTHWNHPRFFAYFPSNSSLASVLAELVTAGLGAQGMSWQSSPVATELEERMMEWLRQAAGLPPSFTGVIQDGGSAANLVAILCARERALDCAQEGDGLQGDGPRLTVYASDQAHASVEKAVRMAGLGARHLRTVPSDGAFAMRVEALAEAVAVDQAAGFKPCAVVATIGSTASTAVDPLAPIAELAARHGLWLHVDAALAGNALILPECRGHFAGVERADSLVFNPHKWLGATFDLSALYLRDPEHLVRVMSTSPSYLRTSADGEVKNYRDWGIGLGRRFRALKLWLLLRDQGVEGIQARLRRDLANARWLREQVEATDGWEVAAPAPFQTVCLRHVPRGASPGEVDAHNLGWAERINRSGRAYLTTTELGGRRVVRVSIGAEATEREDVEALWALLQMEALST